MSASRLFLMISGLTSLSTAMALLVVPRSIPKSMVVLLMGSMRCNRCSDFNLGMLDDLLIPPNGWSQGFSDDFLANAGRRFRGHDLPRKAVVEGFARVIFDNDPEFLEASVNSLKVALDTLHLFTHFARSRIHHSRSGLPNMGSDVRHGLDDVGRNRAANFSAAVLLGTHCLLHPKKLLNDLVSVGKLCGWDFECVW